MKIITLFLGLLLITSLGIAQNVWYPQMSGTNSFLFDVHFSDQNNGWIPGTEGLILHTSDGGTNWYLHLFSEKDTHSNNPGPSVL